jgi:hypothetical protein
VRVKLPVETRNLGISDSRVLGFRAVRTSGYESNLTTILSHQDSAVFEHSDHCQRNLACLCSHRTYRSGNFIFQRTICKNMEPVHKRPKLRVRKAAAEEQPAAPAVQTIQTGGYLWGRDEEELVDYENEDPATLSPMEDDVSVVGDDISAPTDGQQNISSTNNDFPANLAEADHMMVGAKRSQNFFVRKSQTARLAEALESAAHRQVILYQQIMIFPLISRRLTICWGEALASFSRGGGKRRLRMRCSRTWLTSERRNNIPLAI